MIISPCTSCKGSGISGVAFSKEISEILKEKEPLNFISIDFCYICEGSGFIKGAQTDETKQNDRI